MFRMEEIWKRSGAMFTLERKVISIFKTPIIDVLFWTLDSWVRVRGYGV